MIVSKEQKVKYPKLTELEAELLRAIRDSEYHDGRDPIDSSVWVKETMEDACMNDRRGGAVMASLVKKALADTNGESCWMTKLGFETLCATEEIRRMNKE